MMDYRWLNRIKSVPVVVMATLFCVATAPVLSQTTSVVTSPAKVLSQGMANEAGEEIVSRVRGFAAVVTLDDARLNELLKSGYLEIPIPEQLVNSIDSVSIKRPIYFKDKQVSEFANATLRRKKLIVDVDAVILERIDYQPVDLKVYETGFNRIVLRFVGLPSVRSSLETVGDPKVDSPVLLVKLKSGKGIRGRIKGLKSIRLDSTLGQIDVAIGAAEKIETDENGSLKVVMANGDRISGEVDFESIELLTLWENEKIKLREIDSFQAGGAGATLRVGSGVAARNNSR